MLCSARSTRHGAQRRVLRQQLARIRLGPVQPGGTVRSSRTHRTSSERCRRSAAVPWLVSSLWVRGILSPGAARPRFRSKFAGHSPSHHGRRSCASGALAPGDWAASKLEESWSHGPPIHSQPLGNSRGHGATVSRRPQGRSGSSLRPALRGQRRRGFPFADRRVLSEDPRRLGSAANYECKCHCSSKSDYQVVACNRLTADECIHVGRILPEPSTLCKFCARARPEVALMFAP